MATPNNTRQCKNCKETHPLTIEYFPVNGKLKDGSPMFRGVCRTCWQAQQREYFGTEHGKAIKREGRKRRDPEKVKAEKRRSAIKHPESQKRRSQRFLENHPDYIKEQTAKHSIQNTIRAHEWYKNNRERFNAAQRRRFAENPILKMKASVTRHKRRARMREAEGSYTHEDIQRIFEEQNEMCAYCGIRLFWNIPYDIHIDHIRPLARGGTNWPDNLACTCAECNLSKGDKQLDEWIQSRGW